MLTQIVIELNRSAVDAPRGKLTSQALETVHICNKIVFSPKCLARARERPWSGYSLRPTAGGSVPGMCKVASPNLWDQNCFAFNEMKATKHLLAPAQNLTPILPCTSIQYP